MPTLWQPCAKVVATLSFLYGLCDFLDGGILHFSQLLWCLRHFSCTKLYIYIYVTEAEVHLFSVFQSLGRNSSYNVGLLFLGYTPLQLSPCNVFVKMFLMYKSSSYIRKEVSSIMRCVITSYLIAISLIKIGCVFYILYLDPMIFRFKIGKFLFHT